MTIFSKNKFILLAFFLLFSTFLKAQDKPNPRRHLYKEWSFNTNSLLQHVPILPFGETNLDAYDILYRWRKWGKRSTSRFGFSGLAVAGNRTAQLNSLTLKFGKEWHYILVEKWSYYLGFDVLFFAQNNGNRGGLGVGPIGGLRFKLNDNIYLSTESSLYVNFSGGFNGLEVSLASRPPNSLSLNIRFYQNQRRKNKTKK